MNQTLSPSKAGGGASSSSAPRPQRVALVASTWHRDIVDAACDAIRAEFASPAASPTAVDGYDVPGAFEIPLLAKKLAASDRYDAIIACGLVVNGGIYRHEFVAAAVIDGLMRVQIESGVPVLSAVLTPRDFHDHEDHRRFFRAHLVGKGREVAQACLATIANHRALEAIEAD